MALVQTSGKKQSDAISGTVNYTFPGNVTAGNTVIIALSHFSSTASEISGITVSGTAAVKDISKTDGTGNFAQVWRASNCAGGSATIAVTFVGSGNFINFSAEEWDNISSSPLDQTGTGGATSSAAPSVTSAGATTQADEVVYAVFTDYVGTSWTSSTPPSGYTETYEETNGTAHEAGSAAYRVIASTGSQTATFATGSSMSWISAMATYKLTGGGGGATPTISSTSSSTPAYTSSLTITGTNFEAAQGIGTVTIGGVLQTVTAWSDTSITITVGRGTNKYGVSVNVVVTNNSALSSSGYALTSLQPQSGWSYVDIATPNTTTSNRITSVPDLASGDQVSYTTLGGQVVLANDGTFSVAPEVRSFDFEVWSSPDGWGGSATQYVRVDLVDIRLRRIRQRSAAARWMWAGYTNEKLTQRGWFSRDIVLPVAASGGAAALQASVASAVTVTAALSTQVRLVASSSGQVTVAAALTTQIPLAAASAAVITASAALTTQIRLAATPAGQATVTAALTTGIPLAALAQSVVTVTAALASNAAALQSTVQGQTTLTAALSTGIPLAAAAQGVTTVTAALAGTAAPLQASAQAQSTVAADLTTQIRLQATVANVATLGAQLSTGIQLATAASSSCTVTAALTTAIRLQATVQAVITASATLAGTAAALQASVQSQATVSAALTVAKPLACVVIAQAQVSATLTTRIALQAIAQAQTTATAALTTQQSYEAAVLCSVTLSAAFQVHPGARASAPGVQLARSGGQSLRRPAVVALRRK